MSGKEQQQDDVERSEDVDDMLSDIVGEDDFGGDESKDLKDEKKKKDFDDEDTDDTEEDTKEEEEDSDEQEDEDEEESDEDDTEEDAEEDDEESDDEDIEDDDKDGKKKRKKVKKTETETLQDEIGILKKTINDMVTPPSKKKDDDPDDSKEDDEEDIKPVKKGEDIIFITEDNIPDDVSFSGEEDIKFLNDIMNKVRRATLKESLTSTAKVVTKHVSEQSQLRELRAEFYTDNPDLKDVKFFVGFRVAKLAEEHPDWDYRKLFSVLGDDVRDKLAIRKTAEKKEQDRKKPAFPTKLKRKSKVDSKKKKKTGIESEIDDILD